MMLLEWSSIESTTPADNDVDDFCRWTTPELRGARAASTDCELATRELVETARSRAGRHTSNTVAATSLSYQDLIEGGCVNRSTFDYVPDNGMYAAFKTAVRINQAKPRRYYGIRRYGETKLTQSGDVGIATFRHDSCDDQPKTLIPRHDVHIRRTNQASCSDNDETEPSVTDDVLPGSQFGCCNSIREEDAELSSGRRSNKTPATCCGDELTTKQEQRRSDSRLIKTWLYNFLPPVVSSLSLDHADADPLRRNLTETRSHLPRSQTVSGRIRDRRPINQRHRTVAGRKLPTRLDDRNDETVTASCPRAAASDAAVHSQDQGEERTVDVDRRSRRRFSDTPTDNCPVYFNDACLRPHCDCSHHQDVCDDHEYTTHCIIALWRKQRRLRLQ